MTTHSIIQAEVEVSKDVLLDFTYLDYESNLKSYPFYSRSRLITFQQKHDLRFTKHMGQNFLIDKNTAFKIVSIIPREGKVLEIGPGLGALTLPYILLNQKKENFHFSTIELDPFFAAIHRSIILNAKNLNSNIYSYQGDFLEWPGDNGDKKKDKSYVDFEYVFGNLPYSISSPILNHITENFPKLKTGIFMLQKDFIDRLFEGSRLIKNPKNDKRESDRTFASSLALKLNLYGSWNREFNVSSSCFFPRPKIDSTILSFHPNKYREFVNLADKKIIPALGRAFYWGKRKNISSIFRKSPYFHPKSKKDIAKYRLETSIYNRIYNLQTDIEKDNLGSQVIVDDNNKKKEKKLSNRELMIQDFPSNMDLLESMNLKDLELFKRFFKHIANIRPQDFRFIDWLLLSRFLQEHGIV